MLVVSRVGLSVKDGPSEADSRQQRDTYSPTQCCTIARLQQYDVGIKLRQLLQNQEATRRFKK